VGVGWLNQLVTLSSFFYEDFQKAQADRTRQAAQKTLDLPPSTLGEHTEDLATA